MGGCLEENEFNKASKTSKEKSFLWGWGGGGVGVGGWSK